MEAQAWETLTPEEQESITQLTLRFSAALKQALEEEKNKHPLIGGPVIAMTVLEKMSSALGKS